MEQLYRQALKEKLILRKIVREQLGIIDCILTNAVKRKPQSEVDIIIQLKVIKAWSKKLKNTTARHVKSFGKINNELIRQQKLQVED